MSVSSTRAAILDAARRQVGSGGPLSVQAVAAAAGVSRQTVHRQVGGARGLRATLAAEGLAAAPQDEPTRDRLVEAAARMLARPGGGRVSIEAIAAEAGLTKGAVYHHFGDRGELLRAVARLVSPVDEIAAALAATGDLPLREGLVAFTRSYYSAMRARADLIRNLAANTSRDPELTEIIMGEIIGRGEPIVLAWFGRHVARGSVRRIDPSLLIQALFGPVFLLVVLGPGVFERLASLGINPAIDNVEAYVDLILQGVAPESERVPSAPPPSSVRLHRSEVD